MRLLAILLLAGNTWAQIPSLHPRVVLPGEAVGDSFWLLAPSIVVVKVDTAEWVGPEIEITPPQSLVVRLVRVSADVETVIQGQLPKAPIRFYFFANTLSRNGYHTVFEWCEPGKRYLVFLKEDGEVLRTMADVAGLNIRIWSGRHDDVPGSAAQPGGHDPRTAIAYLALSPSADVEEGFAVNIERVCGRISQFAPPSEMALLLRKLLSHRNPEVRAQACLTLSRSFSYRDPCLPELVHSTDKLTRGQAGIWLGMKSSADALVNALKEDPFSLSISGRVGDLPGDLELFTFDSDVAVRRQACDTLARLFPSRQFPNCLPAPAAK